MVNNKLNTYAANMGTTSSKKTTSKLPQLLQNTQPNLSYAGNMKLPTNIPTNPVVGNLKTPSLLNGAVIGTGGGSVGKVTNEGVIVGGGAVNSTFNNISSGSNKVTTNNNMSYASNLLKNQLSSATKAPAASVPTQTTSTQEQKPAEKIDSYEEFLEKQKDTYKETLDKTNQLIEEQKQAAIQNAETARQRSVADARSSYEQNKATYGANAEALASMGLSGSGYSDYVNSQAYAQQRADTQNANAVAEVARMTAESEASQGKLSAEMSYADSVAQTDATLAQYKQQQADKKDSYYVNLLDLANKGAYSAEQLQQLATGYGLNATQIKSLTDAATTYTTNKQNEKYNQLLNSSDTSGFDALKSARDNGEITAKQYTDLVTSYQSYYYDLYSQSVDADFTMVNTSDIDSAYSKGYITKAQYDKLKDKYNSGVVSAITAASIFYANGNQLDEKTAQAALDELKNTSWLTDENKSKLQSLFDSTYNDDGGCFAKGTMITVADGSQVAVENLKVGDAVLVFNHSTGAVDISPISFIFYDGQKEYDVLKLNFDGAASVEVLYAHGFFDTGLRKYVLIDPENVKEFIGHKFYRVVCENGAYRKEAVTLTDFELYRKETECYSVLTAGHINNIVNGMLAVTDDIKGLYNVFELDSDYKYDEAQMAADIEKYGLFTYDDWRDYATEEQFDAFNGACLKVAIGKGLVTVEEIVGYINRFLQS